MPACTEARKPVRLARNYGFLIAGEGVAKLCTFLAFSTIGRRLGPERYGQIELVLAAMVFFTLPVDFGLGSYGAREIAKDPSKSELLLADISTLRLLQASVAFLGLLVCTFATSRAADLRLLLLLYGVSLFGIPALLQWFLQAYDRMSWVAAASILRYSVFAGCVFAFAGPAMPVWWIGAFECLAVASAAAICLVGARRCSGVRLRWHGIPLKRLRTHLYSAGPIGLAEMAWACLWYAPTVILGVLAPGQQVGWFTASHRIVMGLHTFVWLYFFNMLPSISRCVAEPKSQVHDLISKSLRITGGPSIVGALLVAMLAGPIGAKIYGDAFRPAGDSLAVLIWLIPLSVLSGHYRFTLVAYDLQRQLFRIMIISALVAVAICLALVTTWGAVGAGGALVTANVVTLVLAYRCVRDRVTQIGLGCAIGVPGISPG